MDAIFRIVATAILLSFSSNIHLSGSLVDHRSSTLEEPYFDNSTITEITTFAGHNAYLHCKVRNLGDRIVSWMRKRDFHILTVALYTYTSDQRFQCLHADSSDEWILKVSTTRSIDSGIYECQVSTVPQITQEFHLNVIVPQARIWGNPELFIKIGSVINLTCEVLDSPDPPPSIYWYHGSRVINYSERDGINVVTDENMHTSSIIISRASKEDSGNYTCFPSFSNSASVLVHILMPQARIWGNPELFIKSGSDVNLTCEVLYSPDPPPSIYWYHGQRVINYSERGNINVVTDQDMRTSSLIISGASEEDSGNYTCYPSFPNSDSVLVHILMPQARIWGSPELFIKNGSVINLTCEVLHSPDPPPSIYWYHGPRVINYSQRGNINVVTDENMHTSSLIISGASEEDSGNYTCFLSFSNSASVMVHILSDERPDAMQHGDNSSNSTNNTTLSTLLSVL